MKCIAILVLFLTLYTSLYAQDSVTNDDLMTSHRYRLISMGLLNSSLATDTSSSFGLLVLDYSGDRGDFRKAQQTYSGTSYKLFAQGYNVIGRFRVAGDFTFIKQFEDSLANSLRGNVDDIYPYYYFATKSSTYQRQTFVAQAQVDYEVGDGFSVGLGARHHTHWSAGTVDPRPKTDLYNFILIPNVSYRHRKTHIGLGFIWRSGTEDNAVTYKNSSFGTGTSDPSRTRYINLGYGTLSTLDTASLRKYDSALGMRFSLQTKISDLHILSQFSYEASNQKTSHNLVKRRDYYYRISFDLKTIQADILLSQMRPDHSQQLDLRMTYKDGRDYNMQLLQTNYLASEVDASIYYSRHWRKRAVFQYEAGGGLVYGSTYRKDGGQAHEIDYKLLTYQVHSTLHYVRRHGYSLYISPFYRSPYRLDLSIPSTQINIFSRAIAFPDYYYAGSRVGGINARFDYINKDILRDFNTGLFIAYAYEKAFSQSRHYVYPADRIPQGSRSAVRLGLSLSF